MVLERPTATAGENGFGGALGYLDGDKLESSVLYRVNAGGSSIWSTPGWSADTGTSPSDYVNWAEAGNTIYATSAAIDTSDATLPADIPVTLFQTERWDHPSGAEMVWRFPVSPGSYEVRLYFAEIYFSGANQRVFDVAIEGQQVLNAYDIVADVGALAAVMKSFVVTADSAVDIVFSRIVQNPKVSAIEIIATTSASPPPSEPSPSSPQTEVAIQEDQFSINGVVTHGGTAAEGLLLNSRMVQAIFDDENPTTRPLSAYRDTGVWDAERNVQEFIASLPLYAGSGLRAFTVNLQGGSPGWSVGDSQPGIVTAYHSDGTLKNAWLNRLDRVIRAADEQGIVVIVGMFYFGQDHRLANETAVVRAVDGVTDWLLAQGYMNVLVEINNEADLWYDHAVLQPARVTELISRVQQRSSGRLKVSTSLSGGALPSSTLIGASDYILLHGNGQSASGVASMVDHLRASAAYQANPKPIVFNEDSTAVANLDAAVGRRASWGYYDQGWNNYWDGFQSPPVNWTINTSAKRTFFDRVAALTGTALPPSSTELSVMSFTLINADTDQPISGFDTLPGGSITIDLSQLPTRNLNLRANTSPSIVGSVRFGVNANPTYRLENVAPYALAGDTDGNYYSWTLGLGTYVITATPFSGAKAGGCEGVSLTLTLTISDSAVSVPPPAYRTPLATEWTGLCAPAEYLAGSANHIVQVAGRDRSVHDGTNGQVGACCIRNVVDCRTLAPAIASKQALEAKNVVSTRAPDLLFPREL